MKLRRKRQANARRDVRRKAHEATYGNEANWRYGKTAPGSQNPHKQRS